MQRDWSARIEKVPVQSRPYKAGEVPREEVVNISKSQQDSDFDSQTVEKEYPHLFKPLDSEITTPILVPMHSTWFNPQRIHDIERRTFKLEGEEEQNKYMEIRNKIFNIFQKNSDMHLTITLCRKNLIADISEIIRIHSFLEHWGLINYKIGVKRDMAGMLSKIKDQGVALNDINLGLGLGDVNIKLASNSSNDLDKTDLGDNSDKSELDKNNQIKNKNKNLDSDNNLLVVGESNLSPAGILPSLTKSPVDPLRDMSKTHHVQSSGPRITSIPSAVECTECHKSMNGLSGEDKIYFADKERIILCKSCFDLGRYPSNFSYTNFHLLEAGVIRQIWTPEEEMLLLEGIEGYKDNWKAVAAHVKTKTVEQCVLHFLKMGIQDPLIEMEAISFIESKVLFNYTLNPVMSTVAFLASVVHPGVASAAAKAAAEEIQRLAGEKQDQVEEAPWLNDRLNEIAAVALSACLSRAEEQKSLEEGKKERLLELLVESELKRIEHKIAEFTELSNTLKKERSDLEKMRETYRKAHFEARKEISEIVSKVRKICEETGRNFEEIFFKEQ
ncbi:SWI/SNF related-matrix-associated actin-dependent regulator of chromatin subfamily C [Nematocida homosporus]|uniref:SWI/SNF related-matrix-associated actin-dependent regulator of chromatin subfamily C n=1 Tax=Nematocida homosporus TaxID=1912981 RepID=UPI00221F5463|nr:SWI/SNF related-matrix-associated actin-dependent regulator of chromatin subfamily C [Nematocida homosporus]KAI5185085.1 SWI/SNF related-matrix-associated actin-dependent regulator of chromatin subfamily C [Nematocida homosporus]